MQSINELLSFNPTELAEYAGDTSVMRRRPTEPTVYFSPTAALIQYHSAYQSLQKSAKHSRKAAEYLRTGTGPIIYRALSQAAYLIGATVMAIL